MRILKRFFGKKEEWTELETLYTRERAESVSAILRENQIPYKLRAALLPVSVSPSSPPGTAGQPLWYLSVYPKDVSRVRQYLRQG